jgi:uncharacterized protein
MKREELEAYRERIAEFCRGWKIKDFAFFGSVLRDDFGPGSDIDVLVAFEEDADWSLLDHVRMKEELSSIMGRRVDLVTRRGIERSENRLRREGILGTAEVYYAS